MSTLSPSGSAEEVGDFGGPISYILVKLATRCNLACSYCYWFRDNEVYDRPPLLTEAAESAFLFRLEEHLDKYCLKSFKVLLHGGEPLLFGPQRLERFVLKLHDLARRTGCELPIYLTTNAVLVNAAWAELLAAYSISCTVSIDGPRAVHDRFRIDSRGNGSHAGAVRGLRILQEHGVSVGVLSVCDPASRPEATVDYFVDVLGVREFDVLVPDPDTYIKPVSIAAYYIGLFDHVYFRRAQDRIRIRLLGSILKGMLGGISHSESIGVGPVNTVTLLTDGALEPLDVLRTLRCGKTKTRVNVKTHALEDIKTEQTWQELYRSGKTPCRTCQVCRHFQACGGGHIASRWREGNGFDNPSIYCSDYLKVFDHIWKHVAERVKVSNGSAT